MPIEQCIVACTLRDDDSQTVEEIWGIVIAEFHCKSIVFEAATLYP